MKRSIVSLVIALVLAGCGPKEQAPVPEADPYAEEITSSGTAWLEGKKAYDEVCAGCHEEGVDGAPKTGDRDAWDQRSWLWEAVLFEHARTGYEDMPAKGDAEELDEATVTKAAEYMLTVTYPETHRD